MTRRLAALVPAVAAAIVVVLGALAGPTSAPAQEASPQVLPARIDRDLAVEGTWTMDRDVVVAAGATLRLLAGARIVVAATDAAASGDMPEECELHVHGRLVAEGTPGRPVVLAPDGRTDWRHPAWLGVVLHADRSRAPDSVLAHVKFHGARQAVQVTDGTPRLERCVFHACGAGVAAGRLWNHERREVEPCKAPQPDIVECLFAACGTGVYVEMSAAPSVVRSSFLDCAQGIGNERRGWFASRTASIAAQVDRCLFLRNGAAVGGSAFVENSIFLRNRTAFEVTRLHGTFSTGTDRIAWRRNVLWGNDVAAAGESDVGGDEIVADPRLDSEPALPEFDAAAAPLAGVELAADSPVRGTALDGGDPGPAGRAPAGRRRRAWPSADRALRRVLVLGPPDRIELSKLPKSAPAAAGERVGDAWWAAFDTDAAGGLDRSALRWPDKSEVVPAAFLWTIEGAAAGLMDVEVNVDGTVAVWRGGSAFPFPNVALRNGSRGVAVPAPVAAAGGIVVWWKSADFDPRIGVALQVPAGAKAASAAPVAPVVGLDVEAMRFGPKQVGFRVNVPFHWADLRAPGVFRLRAADGGWSDLGPAGLALHDARGTLRADLPPGVAKAGARFVIDGLRDPWGRTLAGQPVEIDVEPAK